MSELTECNHCKLNAIRARAKKEHKGVRMIANPKHGGYDIHIVRSQDDPPVKWNDDNPNDPTINQVAWMLEITSNCVC